jgi:hypothetical protein
MATRKKLLKKCQLRDTPETQHCFADATHWTCCSLGPAARKYSMESGNPIGEVAQRLSLSKTSKKTWCTCQGSAVCTAYSKKFRRRDGTSIKFAFDPIQKRFVTRESKSKVARHRTPGVP